MRIGIRLYIIQALILISIFQISGIQSIAQQSHAKATADTSRILIGDQVNIVLEVNQEKSSSFEFPVFRDTIIDKLEVLSVSPIDTLELEGRLKLRQRLLVTSFDTGFYIIPSFIFHDRLSDDSLKSNALSIEVLTMEIDTTKGITDIKLPFEVPVGFWEIAPYIIVGLLLIALAIFIWYYYKRKKQVPEAPVVRTKPLEPAHMWALKELDQLSMEKLWQKGKIKLYHSRLTDIVRTYIEFRFEITAMEFTTSEIIAACIPQNEITDDVCGKLQSMLELADLVKFAKWNPQADENESSQQIAYDFVLKTKLAPVLRKSDIESTNTQSKKIEGKEKKDVE